MHQKVFRENFQTEIVGAVIVNKSRQIIGTGYNGFPHGCSDDDLPWEKVGDWADTKYPYGNISMPIFRFLSKLLVCHAEMNAILNKNTADCTGATIYTTLFPCNECSKLIIQSRIKRVVYAHRKTNGNPVFTTSERLLEMAKIETVEFESKNQVIFTTFSVISLYYYLQSHSSKLLKIDN